MPSSLPSIVSVSRDTFKSIKMFFFVNRFEAIQVFTDNSDTAFLARLLNFCLMVASLRSEVQLCPWKGPYSRVGGANFEKRFSLHAARKWSLL